MELRITDKFRREVERYRSKEVLKAVLAVCALAARANPSIALETRYRIDAILDRLDLVELFDRSKVTEVLNDYIFSLDEDRERASAILHDKVKRMAGDHKRARTLLRIAYLIMMADEVMTDAEQAEFDRLCALLSIAPEMVTSGLTVPSPPVPSPLAGESQGEG